jgi:hypothetical protein
MPPDASGPDVSDSAPLQHVDFSTQPNDFELGQGYFLRVLPDGDVDLFHARGGVRIPWATWTAAVSNASVLHDVAVGPPPAPARVLSEPTEGKVVGFFAVPAAEGAEPPAGEASKIVAVHPSGVVDLALVERDGAPVVTGVQRGDVALGASQPRPFWLSSDQVDDDGD